MRAFKTSQGNIIPAIKMNRMFELISGGMDWQKAIHHAELRENIPEHENDLDEINEVLAAVEEEIEQKFEKDHYDALENDERNYFEE